MYSGYKTGFVLSLVHPFLLGRCLWVASKFPAHLQQQTITSFLEGTVVGLGQVCTDVQYMCRVYIKPVLCSRSKPSPSVSPR